MNVSLTLSTKEAAQVHQILKAFDEGLIINPSGRLGFRFTLDWRDHLLVVYHCDKD